MNEVNEAVNAATKYATEATEGVSIMWILVLLAIFGAVFFYLIKSGIIGKEDQAKIQSDLRKLRAKFAAKEAEAKVMAEADAAPKKSKAERIAEAKALLGEGDAFNQAAARIAAEP